MKKQFEYEAVFENGEVITGNFEGTQLQFKEMIVTKKLIITSLKEKKIKVDKRKFNDEDFLSLIEEFYYLTNSGMSLDHSIKLLIKNSEKESLQNILKDILKQLKNGSLFSQSLLNSLNNEKYKFDKIIFVFLTTSEEIGKLDEGLNELLKYLQFQKKIKTDIKQAMAYPLFLVGMSVVVSFLIFFLIIPRFSEIFTDKEFEQLPQLSKIVLNLGTFLNDNFLLFIISTVFVFTSLYLIFKKSNITLITIFYKIPFFKKIIIELQLTISYNAISTMLKGGIQLDKALKHTFNMNLLYEIIDLYKKSYTEVRKGYKISNLFSMSKIIPNNDVALIMVGENSSSLDIVFESLSKKHNENFNNSVKKLLSLLEPLIIVSLGIFISLIVVSIMMAVMSLTDIAM